jgi:hypothetical protein
VGFSLLLLPTVVDRAIPWSLSCSSFIEDAASTESRRREFSAGVLVVRDGFEAPLFAAASRTSGNGPRDVFTDIPDEPRVTVDGKMRMGEFDHLRLPLFSP